MALFKENKYCPICRTEKPTFVEFAHIDAFSRDCVCKECRSLIKRKQLLKHITLYAHRAYGIRKINKNRRKFLVKNRKKELEKA